MANKIVTFTFKIDNWTQPNPKVSQITLDLMPLETATAEKVSSVMTDMVKKLLPILEKNPEPKYVDNYTRLKECQQFTVSLKMPPDEKKFSVFIENKANADIEVPLKQTTVDSLNIRSLAQRATAIPPESHGLLYRIFAAICRLFRTLFCSESNAVQYAPMSPKSRKAHGRYGTFDSTHTTPPSKPIIGIYPLQNGNNICFINAVFQSLMNIPELLPVITEAHQKKIDKETSRIEEINALIAADQSEVDEFERQIAALTSNYSWYSYFFPDPKYSEITAQMQVPLSRLSQRQTELKNLKNSIKASTTLIEACEAYNSKKTASLNPLRGFDPTFGSSSQEDAHDLLVRIFDPLIEPLRNGRDADGHQNIGIIPANIDPSVRASLSRFIPKIGEEKQLERVVRAAAAEERRMEELNALSNVSPLPPYGLRKEIVAGSSIPFAVPCESTSLQHLITSQLEMQDTDADDTSIYVADRVRGDYRVSKKRIAIESVGNPPEFLTVQLKRFTSDEFGRIDKNTTQVTLPPDNRLALMIGDQKINYEIHAVLVHAGSSPRGGHYFSYVRKGNSWVEANDSHVAQLDELPDSVGKDAYVIFLKKV